MGIAIDRTMLSKIESGIRPVYDYEANALAQALRIPIAHLFDNKSGKRANHPITINYRFIVYLALHIHHFQNPS
jgi:transcriptional regulator with XRE-family HTH domain